MSTYVAKPATVEKKWILIDAEGLVVGRLAALIATRLKGKHKPIYTPHVDCGDNIVVINADKIVFTGAKRDDKVYYRHTGYPGGIKERTPRQILDSKHPERIVEKAVERMLARGPLHRQLMRNLRVYKGGDASARGAKSGKARCRKAQPQERESLRSMATETKTLADLASVKGAEPQAAPVQDAEARQARPRLRDGQAQERRRSRLAEARQGHDHSQRKGLQSLLRTSRAADAPAATAQSRQPGDAVRHPHLGRWWRPFRPSRRRASRHLEGVSPITSRIFVAC